MIATPYLLFLGDAPDALAAKMAQGIEDWRPDHTLGHVGLPSPETLRETALALARVANPACAVVGVSINSQHMSAEAAETHVKDIEARMGLPAVDPFRHGAARLAAALDPLTPN